MIRTRSLSVAGCLLLAPLVAVVLPTASARAQGGEETDRVLNANDFTGKDRSRLIRLREGAQEVTAADKRLLDDVAKWLIYRMTLPPYQLGKNGQSENDLVQEAFKYIPIPDPRKPPLTANQIRFMQEFDKALLPPVLKVLKNPEPIARINAARVLERMSQTGQDFLAEALIETIKDPNQLDAVKLYAFMGLGDLFKADAFQGPEKEDRILAGAEALIDFINRKPKFAAADSPRLHRQELDGYRYVRREAIRALGQIRYPELTRKKEVKARPALVLFRVANKEGFVPEPSLSERVEAAIGICQLQPRLADDYQLDYATYQLGGFFEFFAQTYEDERSQGALKTNTWHYDSYRLFQALQVLGASANGNAKVNAFVDLSAGLFRNIMTTQSSGIGKLRDWRTSNRPAVEGLFKNQPDSVLRPSGPDLEK